MSTTQSNREKSLGTLSPVDDPLGQLPVVELSAEQIRRSSELAIDRNESYEQIGGGTAFGGNDSPTSHQIGILGEIAVADLYNDKIDTQTYKFGDGGVDLDIWKTENVKSTATQKMQYPQLLVNADSGLTADLYFQAHITNWGPSGARVRILGYAPRELVASKTPQRHPGTTENYVVEPSELSLPPLVEACHD
jgi:hypothetical protein